MKGLRMLCLLAGILLVLAPATAYAKTRIHFSFNVLTPMIPCPPPPVVVMPPPYPGEVMIREYYYRGVPYGHPYYPAPYYPYYPY